MQYELKPYRARKDTGVPWLGAVPEAWNVHRGRHLFEIKKRIAGELGHPVLSVTQAGLRVKDVKSGEGQVSLDYSKYQIVNPGEFVMNSMDLLTGGVGISEAAGVTSPDYRVFVMRDHGQCLDRYILHVFRTLYANRGFYAWGQGSAQLGRWRLPRKRFNEFPFPVPPLVEQAAIVRFLDHIDRLVRRYVAAKRKLIALLGEQRQAIIESVIAPNGGGALPRVALRHLATKFGSGVTPRGGAAVYVEDGVPFLRSQNVHFSGLRLQGVARIPRSIHEQMKPTAVQPSDVLLNITGASIGRVCVVPLSFAEGNVNQHVCIIRPRQDRIVPAYLAATLATPHWQTELYGSQNGASREGLTLDAIRGLRIALPTLTEQERVVRQVTRDTAQVDATALRAEREIALAQEYRTRLIADVVTGKVDVREAAAGLPQGEMEPAVELDDEVATELVDEPAAVAEETEA